MHTIQNTLYVMTPQAYAHLENATLRIDVEREKKLQVPLHHLGGVVCFGNVVVSPALMHRLADEGKSLVLLAWPLTTTYASPGLTVGRGLKRYLGRVPFDLNRHRPASQSGAD